MTFEEAKASGLPMRLPGGPWLKYSPTSDWFIRLADPLTEVENYEIDFEATDWEVLEYIASNGSKLSYTRS